MTPELAPLAAQLRGALITPDAPDYDAARAVWNGLVDRRPAAIASCSGVADVIAATRFAAEKGLAVSIRGGGHNIAGSAVADGALMIDLSAMRAAHVDPERRIAVVEGGATLGDLDHEAQAFGLAAPGGVVSTTGVAGLTLGGGFGWLARLHGLAADNLLSVDLVTPDGNLVTASDAENPDLFWALRGGGGNFGVAVRFAFRLHPQRRDVLFGPTFFRLEDAGAALRRWRDFSADAPREACVWANLMTAPPLPFIDARLHGEKALNLLQFYAGDPEEGARVLKPLREAGAPIADAVGVTEYVEAQSRLDGVYEKGPRNYWKAFNFAALSDTVIDLLVDRAATMPTPASEILICQLGGAIADVAPDATAYPHRGANFIVTPGARWTDPADDGRCLDWIKTSFEPLSEHRPLGAYVNFIAEPSGREKDAYAANYERLAQAKARFDPANRLRSNQNVKPSAA